MIELNNVSVRYKRRLVVKQIGFCLDKGAYGLLGPNGAGKTTLLRAISGVLPFEGKITTSGHIGYLPQHFGIYNELTVSEAMMFFALLCNVPEKETDIEIKRCLELTNMDQYADKKVGKLSGGMLRRLGIAQSLLGAPEILLLDEPTTGLDPEERMRFKSLIRGIKDKCIVLLSTHIVEDVTDICDGVMIMHEGKILNTDNGSLIPVERVKNNLPEYYLSCIHEERL